MAEPMSKMELDEVRRWAEQRANPDDGGTTVAETYLSLLATVADARREALLDAAQEADGEAQQHVRHRDDSDGQDAVEHAACAYACRSVGGRIRALLETAVKP